MCRCIVVSYNKLFSLTRINGYFPKRTSGRNERKFGAGVGKENGVGGGSVGGIRYQKCLLGPACEFERKRGMRMGEAWSGEGERVWCWE